MAERSKSEHDAAFAEGKRISTNAPVLQLSDFSREFIIQVDASEEGSGSIITHNKTDDVATIECFSQRFNVPSGHYSATLRGCHSVVLAVQHWRPFLCAADIVLVRHIMLHWHNCMRDAGNILTSGAIALQFTTSRRNSNREN